MCGRYYVDDDTAREIEKIIQQVDEKLKKEAGSSIKLQAEDVHPTETAPVLAASNQRLCCKWQRWGFPSFQGKQVIFNARSESVLEKKMFRDSVQRRRIVVPATCFYEWNKNKEKNIFYRQDKSVLLMAGFYNNYQDEDRFVILTTAANKSMQPVHDRMPLILEPDEIGPWIFDDSETQKILSKTPCLLGRRAEYEQLSLF
ncbi:MAG: SOS response-associated peptidase [Lachnospiraceae bacterium]